MVNKGEPQYGSSSNGATDTTLCFPLSKRYVPLREFPSNSTSLGRGTNDQYFQNSSTVENSQTAFMDCDHLKGAKTGGGKEG